MYFDKKLTNMGLVESYILKSERTKLPLLVKNMLLTTIEQSNTT